MNLFDIQEEKRSIAESFALKHGAVKHHSSGHLIDMDDSDALKDAYKDATFQFKKGNYPIFDSQQEFTDAIKNVVENALL